jgi:nitrogen-specific signal transduction histidine kinase
MQIITQLKKILVTSYHFITIFILLAILVIASGVFELRQSKAELMDLMQDQTHSILETMLISSQSSLNAEEQLEAVIKERLVNNATFLKILYNQGELSDAFLEKFAEEQNLFRINVFNRKGERIYSSAAGNGSGMGMGMMYGRHGAGKGAGARENGGQRMMNLDPIFSGQKDSLILGIKEARFGPGVRYAVALSTADKGAIVVNMEATQLLKLKRESNLDFLVKKIMAMKNIVYFALQDTSGLIVSSANAKSIDSIQGSSFLTGALNDSGFVSRIVNFKSADVFEAVHQFRYQNQTMGLIRIGISLDFLNQLNQRILNRTILNSVLLLFAGVFITFFVVLRQNYKILKGQYQVVESFSANVIQTVSDSVIVYNVTNGIKVFNNAAEKLFSLLKSEVEGKAIESIFTSGICKSVLEENTFFGQLECVIDNQKKNLIVSKNEFSDENGIKNVVLVIRDFTTSKRLEDQLQRKERLTAMGALASGVAHEVRNPLNSIGTIAQQLDKDFAPAENGDEYHKLARIIYSEVKRINETITNFLKFARPDPLVAQKFGLSEFFESIVRQYTEDLKLKGIVLSLALEAEFTVAWDRNRIQQIIVNLIQNAVDSIESKGEISISVQNSKLPEREIEIRIADSGKGIPAEIKSKIFNLYFTTKPKGTGIGLSIVQKIIDEHNGVIFAESSPENGTTFTLQMPVSIS